jgi:hypothetical protein
MPLGLVKAFNDVVDAFIIERREDRQTHYLLRDSLGHWQTPTVLLPPR